MQTTIDKAGRLVVPKELRDRVGLSSGPVEIVVDGAGLRVEAIASPTLADRPGGRLIVAGSPDGSLSDDAVTALRDALQR